MRLELRAIRSNNFTECPAHRQERVVGEVYMSRLRIGFVVGVLLLLAAFPAAADNWTFTGPGNFSDPSKWDGPHYAPDNSILTLPAVGDSIVVINSCS